MISAKTLEQAIEFAITSHKGQFRKGNGRPYIMHPISVMVRLAEIKPSSNSNLLAAAAVLHDTVEDCGVELKEIAEKFGYYVAGLVEELTLDKVKYETIGKTKYLCQEIAKMSSYALCIKLCDRLDNLEDMDTMPDEFITKYCAETKEMIDSLRVNRKHLSNTHHQLISKISEILYKREEIDE